MIPECTHVKDTVHIIFTRTFRIFSPRRYVFLIITRHIYIFNIDFAHHI